jgi:NAD-dependent deacetylase
MCPIEENSTKDLREAANFIQKAKHGTVLSGAGISTASGIPDFRSTGGLWKRFNPLEVASLSAFRYRPERFFQWLRTIALELNSALPNPAHLALTELENLGFIQTVITQNVDGLHQKAGFKTVLEVHGSLQTATCIRCFHKFDTEGLIQPFLDTGEIPLCPDCRGILKPDLILFEEQLPYFTWKKAQEACRASDLIIVIGSSLEVLPVAGLPMLAIEHGAPLIQINKTETYLDVRSDVIIRGDAADVLPMIVSIIKDS